MLRTFSAISIAVLLGACANQMTGPSATATLQPIKNSTAVGVVTFSQGNGRVIVSGEIKGLKPNAEHGFHVHEKGDCSSGDGLSAGGHFNPTSKPHGSHGGTDSAAHAHPAGDLPALKADANGAVKFNFESTSLTVGTGVTDIVGRGLLVHHDSGAPIACAVITPK